MGCCMGVCEVSGWRMGATRADRADQDRRLAMVGGVCNSTARGGLEGAVADGRARGEGGGGGRALQCTTRLCAARGAAAAGKQGRLP